VPLRGASDRTRLPPRSIRSWTARTGAPRHKLPPPPFPPVRRAAAARALSTSNASLLRVLCIICCAAQHTAFAACSWEGGPPLPLPMKHAASARRFRGGGDGAVRLGRTGRGESKPTYGQRMRRSRKRFSTHPPPPLFPLSPRGFQGRSKAPLLKPAPRQVAILTAQVDRCRAAARALPVPTSHAAARRRVPRRAR
jgi:hypothetical protein